MIYNKKSYKFCDQTSKNYYLKKNGNHIVHFDNKLVGYLII